MSTITVVRKADLVCIAADSQTTHGELKQSGEYEQGHSKILSYGNSHIGVVGSAAHEMTLLGALSKKRYNLNTRQSVFDTFRELHRTLKEEYYLNPNEQNDDPYESSRMDILIINPGGIFGIYALREVSEYSRFWASGSGRDFALGAMLTLYESSDNPETIARGGVLAGVEFDLSSSGPVETRTCRLK